MMNDGNYWPGAARRRLSRRRALAAGATLGAGAIAAAAVGCGDDDDGSGATGAAQPVPAAPKRGGTITVINAVAFANHDPHLNSTSVVTSWGAGKAYSRLLMLEPSGLDKNALVPFGDMAEKWEQPDETTTVFTLRKGAKFFNLPPVNGREVTADDVVYSFNRQRDTRVNASFLVPMERWEATDRYTVRIKFSRPDADQLVNISDHHNKIVAKEAVEVKGDLRDLPAIGSGAWMLKDFVNSSHWTWNRNPDYYLKDRPYFDTIQNLFFGDRTLALAALRQKKVLSTGPSGIFLLTRQEAQQLKREVPDIVPWERKGWQGFSLWAHADKPPTNDPRVRQALSKAFDRQTFIQIVYLGAGWLSTTAKLPNEEALLPESEFAQRYARNVQEARQLLQAAGVTDWRPKLIGQLTQSGAAAGGQVELIQAQLKEIGVNATIEPVDTARFTESVRTKGEFEIATAGGFLTGSSTNQELTARFKTGGTFNGPRLSDAELDRLIDQQASELKDRARRNDLLKQIQRRIIDTAAHISLASGFRIGAHYPEVRDWAPALGPDYVDDSVYLYGWLNQ